jgi:hypothetical protein
MSKLASIVLVIVKVNECVQQFSAEDAVAGGYATGGRHENIDFERYLPCVKKGSKTSYFQQRGFYVG